MATPEQFQEWDGIFAKIKRVDDYQKLKELSESISEKIVALKEKIESFHSPRKPSEDLSQRHDKISCSKLIKQKDRCKKKLEELEKQIKNDIENSKKEEI